MLTVGSCAKIGESPYAITAIVPKQPDRGPAVWYRQGDDERYLAVSLYIGRTDGGEEERTATAIHGVPAVSLCLRDLQGRVTECLEYQQFLTKKPMSIEGGVPTFRCRIECVTGVSRRTTQAYYCIRIDATVIVAAGDSKEACQVTLYTCPIDVQAKRPRVGPEPRVLDSSKRAKLCDADDDRRIASLEERQANVESRQASLEAGLLNASDKKAPPLPPETKVERDASEAAVEPEGRAERPAFETELAKSHLVRHLIHRIEELEAAQPCNTPVSRSPFKKCVEKGHTLAL